MLSTEWAHDVAAEWRDKFIDPVLFELSWRKYWESATVPDEQRLVDWLTRDLAKDQALHAGIVKEPLLPTRSGYDLSDCVHCGGKQYVRKDVPIGHPAFGKAFPCPDCNQREPTRNG